ncbi:ribonuclease H family protein, partial [Solemya velum gill symbiont]|uniref:ribonuclease H family protein n=2 Tax=Solemya velum gill symbiont TaxID=2340 RepID=UPI001181F8AD
ISSISNCLKTDTEGTLFVDDFSISYRSKHMLTIERHLQQCLFRLEQWADQNGFTFSSSKTVCMHFCQLRSLHPDPTLTLFKRNIPVVKTFKFLGQLLDSKFSFIPHIKALVVKCHRTLDVLRVLANSQWGSDRDTLLRVYRALVRSKLDYGSHIYGYARPSYLRQLNTIHHTGLRLCLGAFPTSPVESLFTEANEPPLHYRRLQLGMNYCLRLSAFPLNPAYNAVFKPCLPQYFESHQTVISPFGIQLRPNLEASEININDIRLHSLSITPPWLLARPTIILSIANAMLPKQSTSPLVYQTLFAELLSHYPHYHRIYTDGSKTHDKVASAAFSSSNTFTARLPNHSSIFTAELYAILMALRTLRSSTYTKIVIFSDSLSALLAIHHCKIQNPIIIDVLDLFTTLYTAGKTIIFVWIPSHIGIPGNDAADLAAKAAIHNDIDQITVPYTDFKPLSHRYIQLFWQGDWSRSTHNKLHTITPQIRPLTRSNLSRHDQVVISRLRIGHTALTHAHLLKHEPRPVCIHCSTPLTVAHILLYCSHYASIRHTYFPTTDMYTLFKNTSITQIVNYIKEIGIYHYI